MTALKDRFWAKVLFSQFIRHYRKMTPEQKVADIDASMDALEDLDETGDSFGAKMVRWSMERVNQYPQASENGKKGGRPRKDSSGTEEARQNQREGEGSLRLGGHVTPSRTCRPPRDFEEVKDFIGQMKWVREQLAKEGVTNPTQEQLDEKWLEMYGQENSPQDAPNGNAGVDMSDAGNGAASKSPTSCDQFTADGDIREDSQDRKSGTSANNYGVSPHREAGDVSATDSNPITLDSRTDKDGQPNRRTGADSLRSDCHSAPVRLPDFDEFTRFIDAQGLDYTDAREWWEMTMVDRDGHDRDGNPIGNWKGALKRFCKNRSAKRSKGEVK